jgi:hypothetical protein
LDLQKNDLEIQWIDSGCLTENHGFSSSKYMVSGFNFLLNQFCKKDIQILYIIIYIYNYIYIQKKTDIHLKSNEIHQNSTVNPRKCPSILEKSDMKSPPPREVAPQDPPLGTTVPLPWPPPDQDDYMITRYTNNWIYGGIIAIVD